MAEDPNLISQLIRYTQMLSEPVIAKTLIYINGEYYGNFTDLSGGETINEEDIIDLYLGDI